MSSDEVNWRTYLAEFHRERAGIAEAVLAAIGKVESPTQRTAIAMRLLGRSGTELIPLAGSIDDITKRAEELGLVLADDDVWAAKQLGESFAALQDVMGGLVRQTGAVITSNESLHVLVEGLAD